MRRMAEKVKTARMAVVLLVAGCKHGLQIIASTDLYSVYHKPGKRYTYTHQAKLAELTSKHWQNCTLRRNWLRMAVSQKLKNYQLHNCWNMALSDQQQRKHR